MSGHIVKKNEKKIIQVKLPERVVIRERGAPGPPGAIGPPGTANDTVRAATKLTVMRKATETILEGDPLTADNNTYVSVGDASTTKEKATVFGFAANDAQADQDVEVIIGGVVTNQEFTIFDVNKLIFLDEAGVTDVRRTSGWHVILGKSLGAGDIAVSIQPPTRLST